MRVRFHEETTPAGFNVVGEITGTDPMLRNEIVMVGAHYDSWHGGTGATDNGAGSAVMMEVMRILSVLDIKPKRTIRIGLWGGEEQGLIGSRDYVKRHFTDSTRTETVSAYYNIDNGTGRIHGVWLQSNYAVAPIFRQWIEPLRDLGVTTLGPRNVGGTDHLAFDGAGIPGFQFMQDRLEYNSRTHHSTMDVVDRVQRHDMMQMATVVSWFVYNTAMRAERLPRKPLPKPRGAS